MRSANKIRTGVPASDIKHAFRDNLMRSSILNTARMGWFSSDRAVREYAEKVWNVDIDLPAWRET